MGVREPTSPRPAAARARVVASFYGAVLILGFFWHAVQQDSNDVWRLDPYQGWVPLLGGPWLGLGVGLVVVQVFRALEPHMAWLSELHQEFRGIFGQSTRSELWLLALASALGEEVLFRGAMLDAWGLGWSSVVFALLHLPPRRSLWPWTLSALILGALLGVLTLVTQNLGAAVLAHCIINLQNLTYITRNPPRGSIDRAGRRRAAASPARTP